MHSESKRRLSQYNRYCKLLVVVVTLLVVVVKTAKASSLLYPTFDTSLPLMKLKSNTKRQSCSNGAVLQKPMIIASANVVFVCMEIGWSRAVVDVDDVDD